MKMVLMFGKTKNKKTTNCFVYSDGSNGIWAQTNCGRVDYNFLDELDLKLSAQERYAITQGGT